MEAEQREADNIIAIAFPSGPKPLLATIDTATPQTAHLVPPTAPSATTATMATDLLYHGKQPRPTSPAFMMNTIPDNRPGPKVNPLLMVNPGHDANANSFITPTLGTNRQGNGNTVAFENTIPETDKQINTRLMEIANQGPSLETTVTSCPDRHIPERCQYTNHGEHQYQVRTPIKIDPTLTTTTETIGKHGKTTLTEPATIVVPRDI